MNFWGEISGRQNEQECSAFEPIQIYYFDSRLELMFDQTLSFGYNRKSFYRAINLWEGFRYYRMPKRTYQPKIRRRVRVHGFRQRMSTADGRKVLKARRLKGRYRLTVTSNNHVKKINWRGWTAISVWHNQPISSGWGVMESLMLTRSLCWLPCQRRERSRELEWLLVVRWVEPSEGTGQSDWFAKPFDHICRS